MIRKGKLNEQNIKQLTTYLAENVRMFSNYPLKAIEELAIKFEQRIFKAGETVAKHTTQLSEILIIYDGQASMFRENNPDPDSCNYQ